MNLWFSSLLLVVGLFLSSSAQSLDECRAMIEPKSTFDPSYGKWIFIMGFMDSAPFVALQNSAQSMWINFRKTSADDRELVEDIGIRHPTYCKYASSPVYIVRNTAVTDKTNFSCTYHSLPTCKNCLLYMVNSRNTNELLHIMNVDPPKTIHEVKRYRAVYLMAKKSVVSDDVLEHFKKQARCLGFTGEPSFFYDPAISLCSKDDAGTAAAAAAAADDGDDDADDDDHHNHGDDD